MFYVVSSVKMDVEAVVAYGWESRQFYANWLSWSDPLAVDALKGPVLNLGSPQSRLAPAILSLIKEIVLPDRAYMDRVKRHYAMVRERIDGKPPPAQGRPKRGKKRKA
jgi:hypothetical protein